ncbi:MAG TPA: TIGR01777 family protein [Acidimicrobiaceae bacterium]|nr:TIGR01777 family protein [Acidimicrobiaceae bacterium]
MDIALTGSNGLIGTALREELESQGHAILRLVRPSSPSRDGASAVWDPASGSIDAKALEGIDAVVHLAGEGIAEKRWTSEQKALLVSSRVDGTNLLARTCAGLSSPPKRFLSGSAIGYYGDTGANWVEETSPAGSDFLANLCVAWEAAAEPARTAGIATVTLRTGIVLDPRGGALKRQLPFFKAGFGGRSGNGRQYLSWISWKDQVAALTHLISSAVTGPVNLTAPDPVPNDYFSQTLGSVLHRPTSVIPMFGPRLLLGRELADSLLLTSQRVRPAALLADGFEFGHPTLDGALHDLLR